MLTGTAFLNNQFIDGLPNASRGTGQEVEFLGFVGLLDQISDDPWYTSVNGKQGRGLMVEYSGIYVDSGREVPFESLPVSCYALGAKLGKGQMHRYVLA